MVEFYDLAHWLVSEGIPTTPEQVLIVGTAPLPAITD